MTLHDGDRDAEYERRKPPAWAQARRVLGIPDAVELDSRDGLDWATIIAIAIKRLNGRARVADTPDVPRDELFAALPEEPPEGTTVELVGGHQDGTRWTRVHVGLTPDASVRWRGDTMNGGWASWPDLWWRLCEDHGPNPQGIRTVPAPEPLRLGDLVTGNRAVSAPVGTTLRCTTAAVVAIRTESGWSVSGWTAKSDPEHAVRINEWRVVDTGEEQGS